MKLERIKNLNGVSSLWRGSLQTNDDLELLCLKIFRREFEERRGGVDLVSDHQGEEELQVVAVLVLHRRAELHCLQVIGHHLGHNVSISWKIINTDVPV